LAEQDTAIIEKLDLETILSAFRQDYSKLSTRIREVQHDVTCECEGVNLRIHYPSFRQGKATIGEFVDLVSLHITPFALSRAEIAKVYDLHGTLSVAEFHQRCTELDQTALSLFKKAAEVTGRNGEAGELILYLFTEWILGAPQIIAKMALKTNPEMPVHGSDGVHVRFCKKTSRLLIYWGESKLYTDVNAAITEAVKSVTEAFSNEKMSHEIALVKRNIDFVGLDVVAKTELLKFLDPMEEEYNNRHDVVTCLIGFDFDGFAQVSATDCDQAEEKFIALAKSKLSAVAPSVAEKLKAAGLGTEHVEIFFLPVPSVQKLRDLFQAKIGWKT
jgi:hypothetical protein